jgi:hypothetical protein
MRIRTLMALAGAALLVLPAACGDNPAAPDGAAGIVRFSYSGSRSGTFRMSGTYTSSGEEPYVGATMLASDAITVIARKSTSNGRSDIVSVIIPLAVGTYGVGCGAGQPCAMVRGAFDGYPETYADGQAALKYVLQSGTIRVTELSASRVRGTFEGSAYAETWVDGVRQRVEPLVIEGGTFDVARSPGV